MKITFAIKAMNDAKGGAERVLADVSAGLASRGHEISLISFDRPGGHPFYPLHENVRHACLGIGDANRPSTAAQTPARIAALRQAVLDDRPEIVVAFMHSMFVLAGFALAGTGVPVIASEHIVPAHYRGRPLEYALMLASSLFMRRITVLSEDVRASYPGFMHRKMVPIANPVQIAGPPADPAGETAERKIILNVGRLDPQKDQQTLIRAFALLARDYPDWELRIVGEGPLRLKLQALAKRLGLEGRVHLPGTTDRIGEEYRAAHIFALPSRYESFGLATAEAMAHGLPAIGFADCPGTNELIRHAGNGLLAHAQSERRKDRIKAFSGALRQLMDSPGRRAVMGRNARDIVAAYNPDAIVDSWETLLKRSA